MPDLKHVPPTCWICDTPMEWDDDTQDWRCAHLDNPEGT